MIKQLLKYRRIGLLGLALVLSIVVIAVFVAGGGEDEKPNKPITTTTTTLPDKNAQACEFLTPQALLAGGIIADVEPKKSKDLKRCTYEDIGGEVNYITLYVDIPKICDTLVEAAKETSLLPEVSRGAVFSQELDPTIYVKQESRCFFLQASKTLLDKNAIVAIAKYVVQTFEAVDATTTTTTPTTVVLPEVSATTLPGQNTAPSTSAPVG